jgi:hypothetical protein
METNIAARERAVFSVLVDDLHDWIAMLLQTPASPTPFFDWIHDGTVLLALLNAIDSQFTASVQTRARSCSAAASEFQARDNLARFLKGCKSIGVPDVCLFAPDDLVDNKNHKAVVNALLQLARVAARKFGTTPPATIAAELEIEACEAAAEAAVKPVNTEFHTDAAGWQTGVRVPMQPELVVATQSEAPAPLIVSEPEFNHAQLIASPVALVAHIVRMPSTPAQPNKPLPLSPVDATQSQSIALKEAVPNHDDDVSIVIQLDLSGAALAAHAAKEPQVSRVVEPASNVDCIKVPPTSAAPAAGVSKSILATPARSASSRPTSAAGPTPVRTPARARLNVRILHSLSQNQKFSFMNECTLFQQDPIDVAVQQVLDQLAQQERPVSVTASALKSRSRTNSPMPAARVQRLATGCYLVNGERKVYVRLIRDVLMARVGGGWQDFFCFLLRYQIDHAHAIEGTVMEVRDLNTYVAGRPEQCGHKL